MSARSEKENFFVSHYDWIAAGIGLAALAVAIVLCVFGQGIDEQINETVGNLRISKAATVGTLDLRDYAAASNAVQVGRRLGFVTDRAASLFATTEMRVICTNAACLKATPLKADEFGNKFCAYCKTPIEGVQRIEVDKKKFEWEKKYGLKADGKDADGDEFTNAEEFEAKTNPTDRKSHPDYLDGLRIQGPLRETHMPFLFMSANKIPTGWRCSFLDPKQKDDYGRAGKVLTALVGEEIAASGFVLKAYEHKEATRDIAGGKGMTKKIDVSEATVERKEDGKVIKLTIAPNKRAKPAPVDKRATLVYERHGSKTFDVMTGSEIVLSGTKYRVDDIASTEKGAKVVVRDVGTGTKRTLETK